MHAAKVRMEEREEQERMKSGKCRKSSPGEPSEEASKRQANLQKGKHERLYRKAGCMVGCGKLERSMKGDL